MADRQVVIPLYDDFQALDVTGPHEVFAGANAVLAHRGRPDRRYRLRLVATAAGPVRSESGLSVVADEALPPVGDRLDTVLVPGGNGSERAARDDTTLVGWLAAVAPHARRVATVCSGTFLAAATGLCDGRRVTTHWSRAGSLARFCPAATVEPDAIFVRDGALWTSAGVTAGIDLALALVEDDVGPDVAQVVARHLVVYLRRPGGQTQYAAPVWSEPAGTGPIGRARDLVHARPGDDLSVPRLAAAVGLSTRHFTRLFRTQVGEPPARYVERVRVEAARQVLESSDDGLDEVARRCGFGTAETLRRSFQRRLSMSPDAYRRRFAAA